MIHRFAIGQTDFGITTTGSATGDASINISAGTTSSDVAAVTFANSNGVSFGYDGTSITATVQTNYLTTAMASNRGSDFVQATANFFGTNASGTIASNAISVSVAPSAAASINISAGTTSSNVTAVTFNNSNGVSFGYDGTNVTATVQTNYLTTAMASNRGSDFVQATAAFHGTNVSGTIASNDISVSVAAQSVQSINISAGTTSNNLTALTFSNSNNVSFGLNGSTLTATVTVASSQGSINVSAGTTSSNVSAVTFSNSNGVSFGYDGTKITATVRTDYQSSGPYLTAIKVSAGTTSNNLSDITFSNSNNVSFGLNASTITATVTVASTQGSIEISAGTVGGLASAYVFSNSNNVSFGRNGSTITATATVASTQGSINLSAGTTSNLASAFTFSNSNNVSFGLNASTITATVTVATSLTNINVSAGTTSTNASAFTFNNANGVSFGLGTGASAGSITGSIASTYAGTGFTTATTTGTNIVGTLNTSGLSMGVPAYITAAGASPINVSAGTTSNNLGSIVFADSNGVSFGLGTGASSRSITATIASTYAGTGFTTATTAGSAIVGTLNTAGLSMNVPLIGTFGVSADNTGYALSSLAFLDSIGGVTFTMGIGANSSNIIGSVSSITFANSNGVSFGISNSTVTANAGYLSWYENMNTYAAGLFFDIPSAGGSTIPITPFIMPLPISIDYLRLFASGSGVSTTASGTTANTTYSFNRTNTLWVGIYTQGTGASSDRILLYASTQATSVLQTQVGAGTAGSQYTVTFNITYNAKNTTSQYTTSYNVSSGTVNISSQSMSLFTGALQRDIPWATSLSAGNYWIGLGNSSNSASNAGNAALSGAAVFVQNLMMTQTALTWRSYGLAATANNAPAPFLGNFTTNAALSSRSTIDSTQIQISASNPKLYFQFQRTA